VSESDSTNILILVRKERTCST